MMTSAASESVNLLMKIFGCKKQKTMADMYTELSQMDGQTAIVVHFYGSGLFRTQPLIITVTELPIICEEMISKCATHLSENLNKFFLKDEDRNIGPKLATMFGLLSTDCSTQYWVPEAHVFCHNHADDSKPKEFAFRIKVRPTKKKKNDRLLNKIPEGIISDYFFWQCADDFNTGRVWKLFNGANDIEIKTVDFINKNILHILMASACYRLHDGVTNTKAAILQTPLKQLTNPNCVLNMVTLRKVHALLPQSLPEDLRKEYYIGSISLMRCLAYSKLRKYVKEFYEKMGEETLQRIRAYFVEHFLNIYVPSYGVQYFPAEKDSTRGVPVPVDLVIRPHQEGCPAGLYFNRVFKAHLTNIFKVEIFSKECTDDKVRFALYIDDQNPMFLQMKSQAMVESFLSVLLTYCRLKITYYETLEMDVNERSSMLVPPSLLMLRRLHSFGPMKSDEAVNLLKERKQDPELHLCPVYLMYQDTLRFEVIHVLHLEVDNSLKQYQLDYTLSKDSQKPDFSYCSLHVEGTVESFSSVTELFEYIKGTLGLGNQIKPKGDEKCGAMQILEDEMNTSQYYPSYSDLERPKRLAEDHDDQPRIYRDDELDATNFKLIVQGEFSDVYRLKLNKRDVVVKKISHGQNGHSPVSEFYRKGQTHLMRLHQICPRSFVRILGATLTTPLRIVFESMPAEHGSLLARLRDKTKIPLNWKQVGSVIWELADCLCKLKGEVFYRNLCCAKILIWEEKDDGLRIKLGDPSIAMFFDSLSLDDAQNVKRLPWIAPERFENLSCHTVESEVYAFGTVVWEMMWRGTDPNLVIPANVSVLTYFKDGNKLPDPKFTKVLDAFGDTLHHTVSQLEGAEKGRKWVDFENFRSTENESEEMDEYARVATEGQSEQSVETTLTELEDGDGDQEKHVTPSSPESEMEMELRDIQNVVLDLMHSCWNLDPKKRPESKALQRMAVKLLTKADSVSKKDPLWSARLFVLCAIDGNMIRGPDAQQCKDLLQKAEAQRLAHGGIGDTDVLKHLEEKLREVASCYIMQDMLTPPIGLRKQIGDGHFGTVVEAFLKPSFESAEEERAAVQQNRNAPTKVAVKQMKEQAEAQTIQFLQEAINICHLKHDNIVRILGVVLAAFDSPYQLVMEFADKGSLDEYATKVKTRLGTLDVKKELAQYLLQTAKGVQYISTEQKMIHGDLAARNVLLFSSNGKGDRPYTAKLSDFGLSHKMSRGSKGTYYYDLEKSTNKRPDLPIWWMPIEVLEDFSSHQIKFTSKTDVWSFGVVLWEVFSGGECPSKHLIQTKLEGIDLVNDLKMRYRNNMRLPQTEHCPKVVYNIMSKCWHQDPQSRTDFTKLCQLMEGLSDHDLEQ